MLEEEKNNLEMEKMKQEIEMMRLQNERLRLENERKASGADLKMQSEEDKANTLALWCMISSFAFFIPMINTFSLIASIILGIISIKKGATKKAFYTVGLIIDGIVIIGCVFLVIYLVSNGY